MKISKYHNSNLKILYNSVLSILLLVLSLPVLLIISALTLLRSGFPIFYYQDRVGRLGEHFRLIKFRTMYVGAERGQRKFINMNEAHGPVFKIKKDPRFVGIGSWLSQSGLDELPQFINVIKGDMSIVGPRPLPVNEHRGLRKKYQLSREAIKPGIFSEWILQGSHKLHFSDWEKLDSNYLANASLKTDVSIFLRSIVGFMRNLIRGNFTG